MISVTADAWVVSGVFFPDEDLFEVDENSSQPNGKWGALDILNEININLVDWASY